MRHCRTIGFLGGIALTCFVGGSSAPAQTYPSQDVHFVSAAVPGGSPDIITRFLAEKMRPLMKRTIVVENKPGALGNIATEYVARAKPDGYTLYVNSGAAMASNMHLQKKPPIESIDALPLVATISNHPMTIVVRANAPWQTLAELAAELKRKGDKASYGIANPSAKVFGALFIQSAGLNAVEVQYKSAADFPGDLASGAIDFAVSDSALALATSRAGTARILVVSSAQRSQTMPNVPTMKELGHNIDLPGWWAVFAPAGTPKPVMLALNGWFTDVMKQDDAVKFFNGIGGDPLLMGLDEAQAFYRRQVDDWATYVRVAKIEPQ